MNPQKDRYKAQSLKIVGLVWFNRWRVSKSFFEAYPVEYNQNPKRGGQLYKTGVAYEDMRVI